MLLLDEHIDIISARLNKGGITTPRLHADLLDHICTYIEEEAEGDDFEELLQEALQLIAPGGVHEIEEEHFFLFHFHKQLTMKRILFFSGFSTTFLVSTGLTFRVMHWPWANMILMTGYFTALFTLVLIAINAYKNRAMHNALFSTRVSIGIVAATLMCVGSMFKILHWPSANIQFVLGILLLNFIFLPMFFYQLYQQAVRKA